MTIPTRAASAASLGFLAFAGLITLTETASARPADCLMVVNGRNFIDGKCDFDPSPDGSFQVRNFDPNSGKVFKLGAKESFAYVNTLRPGVADASWNGANFASHAQEPLGELKREGACWVNAKARICAWGVGQRPQNAQPAPPPQQNFGQIAPPPPGAGGPPPQNFGQPQPNVAPPPPGANMAPPRPSAPRGAVGKSFYLDSPPLSGNDPVLCVDVNVPAGQGLQPGAGVKLFRCHGGPNQRFVLDRASGQVRIASRPDLCVDQEQGGGRNLELTECQYASSRWSYNDAKAAVSAGGMCWDVPSGRFNANQRLQVWQCHGQAPQRFILND